MRKLFCYCDFNPENEVCDGIMIEVPIVQKWSPRRVNFLYFGINCLCGFRVVNLVLEDEFEWVHFLREDYKLEHTPYQPTEIFRSPIVEDAIYISDSDE